MLVNYISTGQRIKLDSYLIPYTKIHSKLDEYLNISGEADTGTFMFKVKAINDL